MQPRRRFGRVRARRPGLAGIAIAAVLVAGAPAAHAAEEEAIRRALF